jgi:hypothetical protein
MDVLSFARMYAEPIIGRGAWLSIANSQLARLSLAQLLDACIFSFAIQCHSLPHHAICAVGEKKGTQENGIKIVPMPCNSWG